MLFKLADGELEEEITKEDIAARANRAAHLAGWSDEKAFYKSYIKNIKPAKVRRNLPYTDKFEVDYTFSHKGEKYYLTETFMASLSGDYIIDLIEE